jgi:hypothetical protein
MSSSTVTVRFLPPNAVVKQTITANGRSYTAQPGSAVDVPLMDAPILAANGWCQVAGSGTTAQRPANPYFSQPYHDTTLGYVIVWQGAAWRNPASGAAV